MIAYYTMQLCYMEVLADMKPDRDKPSVAMYRHVGQNIVLQGIYKDYATGLAAIPDNVPCHRLDETNRTFKRKQDR